MPCNRSVVVKEFSLTEGIVGGKIKKDIESAILDGKIDRGDDAAFKYIPYNKR